MRKFFLTSAAAIMIAFFGGSISFAQDDGPPNFVPLELQACNYKDRKDRGDLDDAMDEMVKWMDNNDAAPYAAWVLEKFFTGADQKFDFLYMGAWPNGSTMGKDTSQYRATAGDAISAFNEVADCPANLLFGSLNVKAPVESDGQGDGFVLTFSDCTVADGRKTRDAIAAVRAYGEYRDAHGSSGGTWLFFPVYGGGPGEFDFKIINSYSSLEAFGNGYQWVIENAAYLKQNELYDGLLSCDVARAYDGDTIVNTMAQN